MLRTLAVLAEGPGLVPSTYKVAHTCLELQFHVKQGPLHQTRTRSRHTPRQNKTMFQVRTRGEHMGVRHRAGFPEHLLLHVRRRNLASSTSTTA